jgi:hypothetical protein
MNKLEIWLAAWIDMVCGFVGVITFTLYRPWWDFSFRGWATKRKLK